ncbi:TatD family hydrolase [Flavobacterium capsici]|uniref:TatD family hydrolase n=1 Tax=Flavobacterium capsici TaxID=3075618 RepID=A0AA96J4W6_9FLAO|nr:MULTISPECIES: TatD family hydrolase [unclassified Flavobacterium]WNM18251.1 TatD family hydrolase [Flavobacterium sp. PMR2A8]WNM22302.1 TatD family hydrolase [Flavobacterium sp. PMTSA4]
MKFYNLHAHHYTNNPDVVELVNQYPWEFNESVPQYSIGIHPWHIDEKRLETDLKIMEEKLALPECLAVGECGLDKRIEVPMVLQLEVFEKQIALAERFNKPLVLHLVAAYDELIALNKRLNIKVPVVLHGFSKNAQVAKQLLDNGFYLSFGKYLLQNPELKTTFLSMPNDRFLLETDMIAETLEEVYAKAAEYKEMTIEDLKAIVSTTWNTIF